MPVALFDRRRDRRRVAHDASLTPPGRYRTEIRWLPAHRTASMLRAEGSMHTNEGSMFVEIRAAKMDLDRVVDLVAAIGPVVLMRNGQRIATSSNYGESMQDVIGAYERMQAVMECWMTSLAKAGESDPKNAGRTGPV
jgi:hypothetical protein